LAKIKFVMYIRVTQIANISKVGSVSPNIVESGSTLAFKLVIHK